VIVSLHSDYARKFNLEQNKSFLKAEASPRVFDIIAETAPQEQAP